jgi:hypothetical protein
MEKRALSKRQFAQSDFDASGYALITEEGIFTGKLMCKKWGKSNNLVAFIVLNGGEKIVCSVWQNTGYCGLPEISVGTQLTLKFEKAKNGQIYLRRAEIVG